MWNILIWPTQRPRLISNSSSYCPFLFALIGLLGLSRITPPIRPTGNLWHLCSETLFVKPPEANIVAHDDLPERIARKRERFQLVRPLRFVWQCANGLHVYLLVSFYSHRLFWWRLLAGFAAKNGHRLRGRHGIAPTPSRMPAMSLRLSRRHTGSAAGRAAGSS